MYQQYSYRVPCTDSTLISTKCFYRLLKFAMNNNSVNTCTVACPGGSVGQTTALPVCPWGCRDQILGHPATDISGICW